MLLSMNPFIHISIKNVPKASLTRSIIVAANKFLRIYYARVKECLVNTWISPSAFCAASLQKIRNHHSEFFVCWQHDSGIMSFGRSSPVLCSVYLDRHKKFFLCGGLFVVPIFNVQYYLNFFLCRAWLFLADLSYISFLTNQLFLK